VSEPDALYEATNAEVSAKGAFYSELVARFGPPKFSGVNGTVELRGANASITIVLSVDERRFFKAGDIWTWGNYLCFQLRAMRVEGACADEFAESLFGELCSALPVWYGHAEARREFDAKNISHAGGGTAAIGVDYSRALPGLYWLNFFGARCTDSIGRERFAGVTAFRKRAVNGGVILSARGGSSGWKNPDRVAADAKTIEALGGDYFFLRAAPSRETRSPFDVPG
jgi:hypothetical protein